MALLPKSITNLIEEMSKLPGVGPKTAARLVFYLLSKPDNENEKLGEAVINLKKDLVQCKKCYNYAESDPCTICSDKNRNHKLLAVVEEPLDIIAIEKTGFDGVYHVLGGVISPIHGVSPEDIRINQLITRIREEKPQIEELILATNPSLEGEATAMYIRQQLASENVKMTRLARGLPVGGDLEYADEATLSRAFEGRKEY